MEKIKEITNIVKLQEIVNGMNLLFYNSTVIKIQQGQFALISSLQITP
jgi:hypothetical protein